ncbi:TIGR03086 family protein [Streptomyces sp. DvalAA-14]|uniref:TIGR03086 family metal-binding protein n=1 Tax=unclassified Streptomyces TaxID=2593676 RepID=UPI00081BC044|nr:MULTISPECIES: TIGR03086 family metal-binding protein [unclassified Streptomyces]MYS24419.1 TIGR03086 family protein [Streptomyces sp. SID4948]SCE45845.1 TIGR03086 family protein [Streptomyces sp. DvalAA-14]
MSATAIAELSAALTEVADAVRPEHLGGRTPCAAFDTAALLGHLAGSLAMCERAARKLAGPLPAVGSTAKEVADAARSVGTAWQLAQAPLGDTDMGFGRMPAALAVTITVQELGLHGWDLARAIGHPYRISEETEQTVLEAVEEFAARARASRSYGPALRLSPNTPALLRALAASGRSPFWTG